MPTSSTVGIRHLLTILSTNYPTNQPSYHQSYLPQSSTRYQSFLSIDPSYLRALLNTSAALPKSPNTDIPTYILTDVLTDILTNMQNVSIRWITHQQIPSTPNSSPTSAPTSTHTASPISSPKSSPTHPYQDPHRHPKCQHMPKDSPFSSHDHMHHLVQKTLQEPDSAISLQANYPKCDLQGMQGLPMRLGNSS